MLHDSVSFGLLGPLSIRGGEDERPIRSPHQRTLIAALLLRAGRLVSTEELVELVWEEQAPSRPRQALQNHVMRVRQVLGHAVAERLRTLPSGYVIDVEDDELDIHRFAELRTRGQAAADVGDWETVHLHLDAALSLWRGEPLIDVPSQSLQDEHRDALHHEHLLVREMLADASLQLGRYPDAVGELRALTATYPWRERLQGRLMIALYGDGRQAEALALFRDFRTAMTEELGIEPDADLQLLHQRMLAQDPVSALLDRVGDVTRPVPAGEPEDPSGDVPLFHAAERVVSQPVSESRPVHRRWRTGKSRRFKPSTALVVAMAFIAGLVLGRPVLGAGDVPAESSKSEPATVEDPLPAVQKSSPDGAVRYVGRAGSDAQILSTTNVDVPVQNAVAAGDTVVVSLGLTSTSAGVVTVTDTAGNVYTKVGDIVDAYWHRTMIYAAFGVRALKTVDRITATYPRSSKYHIAVDEFRGVTGVSSSAGDSNVYEQNASSFTTSKTQLDCKQGDLFVAALATNSSGVAPKFSAGWQMLPILKLSSYRLTTAFQFVTADGKCAATGKTTAQWETTAVVFHR